MHSPLSPLFFTLSSLLLTTQAQTPPPLLPPALNLTTITLPLTPNPIILNTTDPGSPTPRTVTYYKLNNALITDGDVILGPDSLLPNSGKRALSIFPYNNARKWPFGVVPYQYADAATEAGRGPKFSAAIERWSNKLPFLTFTKLPHANGGGNTPGVLLVRAIEDVLSYSYIGYVPVPEIWLGRPDLPSSDRWYTHAIGHTLGLMHEHQRADRPQQLTLDCSKVATTINAPEAVCTNPCKGTGCWFVTYPWLQYNDGGTYDIKSIMHFNPSDFAKNPADPPLKPIAPQVFGNDRLHPTITDANRVCDIYIGICRGVCGDGILSLANGEQCDDGNNTPGDGCSEKCKVSGQIPHCGNGLVETSKGEQCEPPNTSTCNANCQLIVQPPTCGNGVLEPSIGEQCEPPNTQTCDSQCKLKTPPVTCPANCNPNVPDNKCHPSTSCIPLFGAKGNPGLPQGMSYMCACAAGFRADNVNPADGSKQIRVSATQYTSYVFVEPGLPCTTLCSPDTNPYPCSEVPRKDECW